MKTRIGLAVTTASVLFTLSGGVVAQTPAPSLTTLYNFEGSPDGAAPYNEALVIGNCGELYGTTSSGGSSNNGTVFELIPPTTRGGSWTNVVLHSFSGSDGSNPQSGLVMGPDRVLYGATDGGGSFNFGAVFSLTPPRWRGDSWREATLYSFLGTTDGAHPRQLVIGERALYGVTDGYGASPAGSGTVFSLTPPRNPWEPWTENTLYAFTGGNDGGIPYGGLAIGRDGVLYGTAFYGGAFGGGTVFSLTPPKTHAGLWTETTLHSFSGSDGYYPYVGVTIGCDGVLYGATQYGGASFAGAVFSLAPPKSPGGEWTEAVLYSFSYSDGANPSSPLAIGPAGVLYSTTAGGGAFYSGTAFSLAPPASPGGLWTETVLHSFDGTNGSNVVGGLAIAPGSPKKGLVLYGVTAAGGASGLGTVFKVGQA